MLADSPVGATRTAWQFVAQFVFNTHCLVNYHVFRLIGKCAGLVLISIYLVLGVGCSLGGPSNREVRREFICKVNFISERPSELPDIAISKDCKRIAFVEEDDSLSNVIVDGEMIGQHTRVMAPLFSPDGKRFAYAASNGHSEFVVVDGERGESYHRICCRDITFSGFPTLFLFSPDSRHFAYLAFDSENLALIVDGQEIVGNNYAGKFTFSPDGNRIAYLVKEDDEWFMVADGVRGKAYYYSDAPSTFLRSGPELCEIAFSQDSRRLAYTAYDKEKWLMVLDGVEEEGYDNVFEPIFSPDGNRLAYRAKRGAKWFVVVDGEEYGGYGSADKPVFSPDSSRFAFAASRRGRWFAVIDGEKGTEYDGEVKYFAFSLDNEVVTYAVGRKEAKDFLVINGKEEEGRFDHIISQVVFSPDGKRMAYIATESNNRYLIVDGVSVGGYFYLEHFGFSPDGKHFYCMALVDGKYSIIVDGIEGKRYDAIYLSHGGKPVFDSADTFHYIARDGNRFYYVEERIKGDAGL